MFLNGEGRRLYLKGINGRNVKVTYDRHEEEWEKCINQEKVLYESAIKYVKILYAYSTK